MPENIPLPEHVPTHKELWSQWLREMAQLPDRLKEYFKTRINDPLPFEFKPLNRTKLKDLFQPEIEKKQYGEFLDRHLLLVWLKAQGRLPDDPAFHILAAAYASDHYLLTSAFLPHGISYMTKPLRVTMIASLDHMLWFHRYVLLPSLSLVCKDLFGQTSGYFSKWKVATLGLDVDSRLGECTIGKACWFSLVLRRASFELAKVHRQRCE